MANRDMTQIQFSFEKARKTVNAHVYFGASGAITLDGPGSKGVASVTKVATPAQAGTYTFVFGVSVNGNTQLDTYKKLLTYDNAPEIEYSGAANPAATATPALWKDDINNNIPVFGDVAPVQGSVTDGGTSGGFAASAYKFIVTAFDSNGNESKLATALATEQTFTPTASHKLNINWTALTQAGVAGYCVYCTAAAGGSGAENILLAVVPGAASNTVLVATPAVTVAYQPGNSGSHLPNSQVASAALPANALPPYAYAGLTLAFYSGTTLTNPAQGEGQHIQFEFGDSDAP